MVIHNLHALKHRSMKMLEDKEKHFCFRDSKKETDPNNGQKNNGEKEQYRKTYLRHKEKHSP